MKTIVHVNQHNIKANRKDGGNRPVITAKTYKSNEYGHEVDIDGPCKIVYRKSKPLSCGAQVWIETEADVTVRSTGGLDSPDQLVLESVLADTNNEEEV